MPNVWRKVSGAAIYCGDCTHNVQALGGYLCDAENGTCVFLNSTIDAQKTYSRFQDAYADDGDPGGDSGDASRAGPIPSNRKIPGTPPVVWRSVRGRAMFCGDCSLNKHSLTLGYYCDAPNDVCVFLKKELDSHTTYSDPKDIYGLHDEEEEE